MSRILAELVQTRADITTLQASTMPLFDKPTTIILEEPHDERTLFRLFEDSPPWDVVKSPGEDIEDEKALRRSRVDLLTVGDVGASSSRALESAELIGDHDPKGESQTLIGVSGTTDVGTTEAAPTAPTSTLGNGV
ncbi:hypothetical protein HAX54_003142 [Datura stramonium]|uniref:Uncharacterized protein n=1 Tax=Datura stramonium TaxID=4076 RepID=A0ABS8T4X5_DATST|nr:hypothetical protein [Datura stramonium]